MSPGGTPPLHPTPGTGEPLAAIIVKVHAGDLVNVTVFTDRGSPVGRVQVRLWPVAIDDVPVGERGTHEVQDVIHAP